MSAVEARPTCAPRFATERTDRPTRGAEAAKVAELLGHPLLPWQRQVLDVALEYEPDDTVPEGYRYVYREIGYGTPRQSGKSIITLVLLLHRLVATKVPQNAVYSMQTGTDAARKLIDDWLPLIEESDMAPAIAKVRRTMGSQAVMFRTRSSLEILASTKSAGHGRTLDMAVVDEAMHDSDDRREQAVVPAMVTRPNAQIVVTSTAGTDESFYWRRKVDVGREKVGEGLTDHICYFEWSFPDDADPYDEDVWWSSMPALGHTQGIEAVRHAAQSMREEEFRRAFGNQWTRTSAKIIDWESWIACRSLDGAISNNNMVLAFDVNKERTHGSICAASMGSDGVVDVEFIEKRSGVTWLIPRLEELRARHMPWKIVVDGSGPAGALIPEAERAGLTLNVIGGGDLTRACGAFYDHVLNHRLRVRPNDYLDDAVGAAAKRVRGDSFVWVRQSTTRDISPLMTATLAVWGCAGDSEGGALWLY